MENPTHQINNIEELTQEQMLAEILENSRKAKNYMKWQLIITVAFVVLPLIATVAIIPFVLNSVTSVYGGSANLDGNSLSEIQDLLK